MSEEIRVKVTKSGRRKYLIMYYDDPITRKREQRSTRETTRTKAERVAAKWEAETSTDDTKVAKRKREQAAAIANEIVAALERLLRGFWLSGLRLGEGLNLSWDEPHKIAVNLSGRRPMLIFPAHLNKRRKYIESPMTPDFAEFLFETPA